MTESTAEAVPAATGREREPAVSPGRQRLGAGQLASCGARLLSKMSWSHHKGSRSQNN